MNSHGISQAMIRRLRHERELARALRENPVVALLGARQVGKTTLARELARRAKAPVHLFDLERASDLARLADPQLALEPLKGLVVLDEIQHHPELFRTLRVLADRRPLPARFLVLGSATPTLLRQTSESLAGRIAFHELPGLALYEVKDDWPRLWLRGGFPSSFTARTHDASWRWREGFIRTFLERDLPQLGSGIPAPTMRRFWSMLAHSHGQTANFSQLGGSLGIGDMTVRRYLDTLVQTFMVRTLAPWHENLSKRQVKAPKVYLRDTGVLHSLLGLRDDAGVRGSPYAGCSFEGVVIDSLIQTLGLKERECFFWGTYQGAELDLLVMRGGRRWGFEVKLSSSPSVTKSMQIAMVDLGLERLDVIHAGQHTFPLGPKIRAVAFELLTRDVQLER